MKSAANNLRFRYNRILTIILILCIYLDQPVFAQVTGTGERAKLQQFEDAITLGEQYLAAKDFAKAKAEYQKALTIDPTAKYPKDKLTYIRKFYVDPADEARFAQAMESGNGFMRSADFSSARIQFDIAVNIKPEDKTAREKLAEADQLNLAKQDRQKQYLKFITEADRLYVAKDYAGARKSYESASGIDPEATHPKQRISEIDAKTAADKAQKDSYEKTLAEGDEAYMNRDFSVAKLKYEMALKIKPGENYPKSMLERVSQGSEELKDAQLNYQIAIAGADKLFAGKDYETALLAYQNAARILPGETYPSQQIRKINTVLQQRQNLEEDYTKTILAGNRFYDAQQYAEARIEFQHANDLKPNEAYPKQKIEEIAGLLLAIKEAERTKAYRNKLEEADLLFDGKDYQKALISYQEASAINTEEEYPKGKIAYINKLTADRQAAQTAYDKAITDADLKFKISAFEDAIALYRSASGLKPDELYPGQQITKAQDAINAILQKENSFNQMVTSADQAMDSGDLEGALKSYRQALAIKPDAVYPQDQITKINAGLAAMRSKDDQFRKLIEDADALYLSGTFAESVNLYTQALVLKPQEKYPSEQISKINGLMEAQKAKQASYDQQIAAADKHFEEAAYEKARAKYNEALTIFPDETYPLGKISTINSIIEQRKSLEENFSKNIREGDFAYKTGDLDNALRLYEQANALKPSEQYPQDRISQIRKTLADQKIIDDNYMQIIADADRLFKSNELDAAGVKYKEALDMKPSESYPQQQLATIQNLIASQKDKEETYRLLIIEADRLFNQKESDQALTKYQQAQTLKPSEIYPAQQIAIINALKNEIAQAEQAYAEVIIRADQLFESGSMDEAAVAYRQASGLKPSEKHPKDRLALIEVKKSEKRSIEENYQTALAEADRLFGAKDYQNALNFYQKALEIKPSEMQPQARIDEINAMLDEIKQLADKDYNEAIESANRLFTLQDYTSAMKGYEAASAIKPSESYPKNKLIEINNILMERSRNMMDAYNKIIMKADLAYQQKVYDQAIDGYEEARLAKPDEAYPDEMVRKIRKYMEDHAMVDLISTPLVITADSEQKFKFKPIEMRLRKNNYIILKARKTSEIEPKVYLNYGIDGQKSGGIVLRSIKSQVTGDYIVRVSIQDRWYRLDNNWISIYTEGGEIEISKMQVSQGD